jgi:heat shock protein HspQ
VTLLLAAMAASAPWAGGCATRVGYYDRDHHVYHYWNENEDRAYRSYLAERHEDYREFSRLADDEQRSYWQWRHDHADAGHDQPNFGG